MHRGELDRFGVSGAEVMRETPQAVLYRGRLADGRAVVLKVLRAEGLLREGPGARLLARYSGRHSVVVLAQAGDAVLMEWLGGEVLIERWRAGESEAAENVAIMLVRGLHAERVSGEGLPGMAVHFAAALAWESEVPEVVEGQAILRRMLAIAKEEVALHGDVHPRNIMRRGKGWCLIDPIGLRGPRAFDYANMFLNPWDFAAVHLDAARIKRLAGKVSAACGSRPQEVLGWAAANALWWAEMRARKGLGVGYPMEIMQRCVETRHPT